MNAVNYSELQKNLKRYMDTVYKGHDPLIITRNNNENLVMLSIEDYNVLIETDYLRSLDKNSEYLINSLENIRKEKSVTSDIFNR